MQREIKFRVWNGNQFVTKSDTYIKTSNGSLWDYNEDYGGNGSLWSADGKIQQFTGLLDKNGVEIYEGDIVRANHEEFDSGYKTNHQSSKYAGIIHWNHSYWAIGQYKLFIMDDKSLDVFGNIMENPELLEQ